MSELDDFLHNTLARQITAEEAIHNGDLNPRLETSFLDMTSAESGFPVEFRPFVRWHES